MIYELATALIGAYAHLWDFFGIYIPMCDSSWKSLSPEEQCILHIIVKPPSFEHELKIKTQWKRVSSVWLCIWRSCSQWWASDSGWKVRIQMQNGERAYFLIWVPLQSYCRIYCICLISENLRTEGVAHLRGPLSGFEYSDFSCLSFSFHLMAEMFCRRQINDSPPITISERPSLREKQPPIIATEQDARTFCVNACGQGERKSTWLFEASNKVEWINVSRTGHSPRRSNCPNDHPGESVLASLLGPTRYLWRRWTESPMEWSGKHWNRDFGDKQKPLPSSTLKSHEWTTKRAGTRITTSR
jgi:hypothetical protein